MFQVNLIMDFCFIMLEAYRHAAIEKRHFNIPACIVDIIIIIIIIINDIYRAQTSPRSKCAKSAVAQ